MPDVVCFPNAQVGGPPFQVLEGSQNVLDHVIDILLTALCIYGGGWDLLLFKRWLHCSSATTTAATTTTTCSVSICPYAGRRPYRWLRRCLCLFCSCFDSGLWARHLSVVAVANLCVCGGIWGIWGSSTSLKSAQLALLVGIDVRHQAACMAGHRPLQTACLWGGVQAGARMERSPRQTITPGPRHLPRTLLGRFRNYITITIQREGG